VKNELLLLLLAVVLLVQAYIVFVKEPKTIGGSTAYQPAAVQYSGGFGEGQIPPAAPAYSGGQPGGGAPHDDYMDFLIGLILLEKNKENSLTPAQAKELLGLINQDEQLKDFFPTLQSTITTVLNNSQKDFVALAAREDKGNAPTPKEMQELVEKVLSSLQR